MINIFGQRKTITTKTKMKVVKQNSTKKMVKNFFINNSFSFSDTTIGCSQDGTDQTCLSNMFFPYFKSCKIRKIFVIHLFQLYQNVTVRNRNICNFDKRKFKEEERPQRHRKKFYAGFAYAIQIFKQTFLSLYDITRANSSSINLSNSPS